MDANNQIAFKESPIANTNIFSKLIFGWTFKIFYKGTKKDLGIVDLYKLEKEHESKFLGDQLEKNWKDELLRCKESGKTPSFRRALFKTYMCSYMLIGLFIFILECGLRVSTPFAMQKVIKYFKTGTVSGSSYEEVLMYATILNVLTLITSFVFHHTQFAQRLMGMNVNKACSALIYRKVLRLNAASNLAQNPGQVVVLLSNDVGKFDEVFLNLHFLWILPVQLAMVTYLMWLDVNIAAVFGIAALALQTVPVQGYLGKLISKLRAKTVALTDKRVLFMTEFISGIQTIKMYAWDSAFVKTIRRARDREFKVLSNAAYLKALNSSFINFTDRTSVFITIFTYTFLGNVITADVAFAMMQFFKILQNTMAFKYPKAIIMGAESLISIKRIERFLLLDEKSEENYKRFVDEEIRERVRSESIGEISLSSTSSSINEYNIKKNRYVHINNVTAGWNDDNVCLKNVTCKVYSTQLMMIAGSVGSGKSSLLHVLLSELTPRTGNVQINGSISYCSQEPWLFSGTIRNNILFGQPFDKQRYSDVVYACALHKDLLQFSHGDQTIVGDQGASLSGGQKARINLARCIYRKEDIYLLDDPLSAVDTHVAKHLFQKCFEKFLKNKIKVLVTHQTQFLKSADHIMILNNGTVQFSGGYGDLLKTDLDIVKSLGSIEQDEIMKRTRKDSIIECEPEKPQEKLSGSNGNDEEKVETGTIDNEVYLQYLKCGGGILKLFALLFVLVVSQIIFNVNDYWLSFWTNAEERRTSVNDMTLYTVNDGVTPIVASTYVELSALDPATISQIPSDNVLSTETIMYIYLAMVGLSIVSSLARSFLTYNFSLSASRTLHDKMLHFVSLAPMRFFNKNPAGRILNRFSKDVSIIDDYLPTNLFDTTQVFLNVVGSLILIACVNYMTIIPIAITLVIFNQIRLLYLQTAQDIKRLEGITRSPVLQHLTSSISGLTTIRASNAQKKLEKEFDRHQDLHTSAWYLTIVCSTSLGFWIDLLYTVFLMCVTYTFICSSRSAYTFTDSQLGLVLSQAIVLTHVIQRGVRLSAELICQMTSVERAVQYMKIEQEGPFETDVDKKPPRSWPKKGDMSFRRLELRYDVNEAPILKNLNIDIKPGEKIGIVGRTGAGKTSLISSLFRLYVIDGDIIIDGINVNQLGLKDLRSRISIIPQQPILFTGTIRQNLDPFEEIDDTALWHALEEVELKDSVPSLDYEVSSGASSMSLGQKQMICLARAILRNNKILVLDEATANIDPQTDFMIQNTIKRKFEDCTVLTIAHRLHTIMDSDKALVMDRGIMVEFDHPFRLLQKQSGYFNRMVRQTGPQMGRQLYEIAKESFERKFGEEMVREIDAERSRARGSKHDGNKE